VSDHALDASGGANEPEIELRQGATEPAASTGHWNIAWTVQNKGHGALEIQVVRLPHGQFKSEELRFEPALHFAPQASGRFQIRVRCHEPAGLVTENAFVIFSVIWLGEPWRVFVRMRVVVTPEGEPETATELITAQKIGFSGMAS